MDKDEHDFTVCFNTIYFSAPFDGSLEPHYKILQNVKNIIFHEDRDNSIYSAFNRPFILFPNIIHITFGKNFNQPIILTKNIMTVIFGFGFKQQIVLTPNITVLAFGFYFNNPIILTLGTSHLTIRNKHWNIIDNLPNGLKHIVFQYNFNLPLNNLNNDVEYIKFKNSFYEYKHMICSKIYIDKK